MSASAGDRSAARRAAEAARRLLAFLARPLPAPFAALARAEEPTGLAGVEISWLDVSPFGMPPGIAAPDGGRGAEPGRGAARGGAARPGRPDPGLRRPGTAREGAGLGGRRSGERLSGLGAPRSPAPPPSAAAARTVRAPAAPGGGYPPVRSAGDAASAAGSRPATRGAVPAAGPAAAGSAAPATGSPAATGDAPRRSLRAVPHSGATAPAGGHGEAGERTGEVDPRRAPRRLAGADAEGGAGRPRAGGAAAEHRAAAPPFGAAPAVDRSGTPFSAGRPRMPFAPGDAAAADPARSRPPLVPALPRIGALAEGLAAPAARRPAAGDGTGALPRSGGAPAPEPFPETAGGLLRRGIEPPPAAGAAAPGAPGPDEDPDHLASLVNDALVEQARRHGIDLS